MTEITNAPLGLTSLLGSKSLGRNPSDLERDVSAGFDISPFYLQNFELESQLFAGTIASISDTHASITVPTGEVWVVYQQTLKVTPLVAAARVAPSCGVIAKPRAGGTGFVRASARDFPSVTTVGDTYLFNADWPKPWVVRSGTRFTVSTVTATVLSIEHVVLFRSLKI